MNYRRLHSMLIVIVTIVFVTTSLRYGVCAKLYVLEDYFPNKVSSPLTRLKRQTHPAATVAKLQTPDTNAFVPVSNPTQQFNFQSNNNYFPNNGGDGTISNSIDSQSRTQDTPVEYLLPPNPNSQPTSLNFQDPAANLQNVDNIFDVTPASIGSSLFVPPPPLNSFSSSSSSALHNQIGHPPSPTPPASFAHEQVQSISFQNPPPPFLGITGIISPTPPPSFVSQQHNQFFSNKISNTIRESSPSSASQQFPPHPTQFVNGATTVTEKSPPPGGKWDLGWDANEILTPPRDDAFGSRGIEYDTINAPKFRRTQPTLSNSNNFQTSGAGLQQLAAPPPPSPSHGSLVSSSFLPRPPPPSLSSHQVGPSQQFNQLAAGIQTGDNFGPSNDQFIPVNGPWGAGVNNPNNPSSSNHFVNDQSNLIWGNPKSQQVNFGPSLSASPTPFLPTIPPPPSPSSLTNGFPSNGLTPPINNGLFIGSVPPPPPGPPPPQSAAFFQQNQPPPHTQIFHQSNFVNQNTPPFLEPPHTSQFDSFLPQGTVSDHSFPTVNDNFRHFRKRQIFGEDETVDDEEHEEISAVKEDDFRPSGVYSFVKTDRDGHFKWSVRHPT